LSKGERGKEDEASEKERDASRHHDAPIMAPAE